MGESLSLYTQKTILIEYKDSSHFGIYIEALGRFISIVDYSSNYVLHSVIFLPVYTCACVFACPLMCLLPVCVIMHIFASGFRLEPYLHWPEAAGCACFRLCLCDFITVGHTLLPLPLLLSLLCRLPRISLPQWHSSASSSVVATRCGNEVEQWAGSLIST